jgi:hypothetical protein
VIALSGTVEDYPHQERGSYADRVLRVIVIITIFTFVFGLLCFGSAVLINLF